MDKLIPLTFVETLGGLLACAALIAGFLSLLPPLRTRAIQLFALFLVAALSLFSNHWSTYFAGIFVIATAVTELEFLQNLAAIIRGSNKHYFDYKKEILSTEQKTKKVKEEQEQLGVSKDQEAVKEESPSAVKRKEGGKVISMDIRRILEIESAALDKVEDYFESKIERGVRISRKGKHITLDGLIPSVADDMVAEKILEVKYLSNPKHFSQIRQIFSRIEHLAQTYYEITNKIAKLYLVLVIEGNESLTDEQFERLKKMSDSSCIAMGYSVFTTTQLDLKYEINEIT